MRKNYEKKMLLMFFFFNFDFDIMNIY